MRYRPQGDLIRGGGVAGLDWKNANRQRIEDDNARGAVNASAQRRSSQGEIPELLSEPSKLEVVLGRSASSRISDDIYALTHRDNRECGGFLYGPGVRSWDRRITLSGATRTWNAVRTDSGMLMDVEAWYATARAIALEGREEGLLGSFHTHPDSTDGRPSDADLSAWLMMRDYAERHGSSSREGRYLQRAAESVNGDQHHHDCVAPAPVADQARSSTTSPGGWITPCG
jgi:proteasome lid subunit RPN8/RPN11